MRISCKGREDNPIHTYAFNVLIKNLKERNPICGRTTLDFELSVTWSTLFMEENSDGECF